MTKRDYVDRVNLYQELHRQLTIIHRSIPYNDIRGLNMMTKTTSLITYKLLRYRDILKNWSTQTGTHAGYYETTGITTSTTSRFISSKSN